MPDRNRASFRKVFARFQDTSLRGSTSAHRPRWRVALSLELVILMVAVFFAFTANGAFWASVKESDVLSGARELRFYIGVTAALVGLHALLFGLVLNRWIARPVLAILLVTTASAAYFASTYAVYLDPSMVRNVIRTDVAEARELLTWDMVGTVSLMGVLPAAALWLVHLPRFTLKQALLRRMLFLGAMLLLTCVGVMATFQDVSSLMRNDKALRYLIAPGNYLASITRVLSQEAGSPKLPRQVVAADARQQAHAPSTKSHLLVVVVGETVRAQNWGLNGYERQTTPQLSKLNVINFSDVTACGSNTEVSVPCMFSLAGRRNYDRENIVGSESLLHVLERAGVKTLWRDNQTGCKGVCDGLSFESYRKPPESSLCDDQACRDAVMLQGLHDVIDDNPGDTVVVLHQLGNHGPAYFKRYPEALRQFRPDCRSSDLGSCTRQEIVNAYDNAILETDDFLSKTIQMLSQDTTHDTAMIYVSDHGESLGEGNVYLHGLPYSIAPDTQIKVPMVVWLSPGMAGGKGVNTACVRSRASQPISHDNLFHSVLALMHVKTEAYEPTLDVFFGCQATAGASP